MNLPQEFLSRMEEMLKTEYSDFLSSFSAPKIQGLRANLIKISASKLAELLPFELERIPWCENGFYYPENVRPGKSPFHDAGLFYIQEPSAMLPAMLLDTRPGERVLDLCAAPGGKTTQLAANMQNEGIIVANEPYHARAKVLSQNIERMGIKNAIITCSMPDKLAQVFPEFFDKVMVDAPCSGEGMFRKDEATRDEWSPDIVSMCAARQWEILQSAYSMLRPGGRMVYSTCTFSPDEDEKIIARLVSEFGMRVVKCDVNGASSGIPEWADGNPALRDTLRIWPHKSRGEGHFAALLEKPGDAYISQFSPDCNDEIDEVNDFLNDVGISLHKGVFISIGDEVYLSPADTSNMRGIQIVRAGLHIGTRKKNRFEPSHSLALACNSARRSFDLSDTQVISYLNGETIPTSGENGWTLVTYKGYSLGWAKVSNGILKNHYPKGLRRMGNEV